MSDLLTLTAQHEREVQSSQVNIKKDFCHVLLIPNAVELSEQVEPDVLGIQRFADGPAALSEVLQRLDCLLCLVKF